MNRKTFKEFYDMISEAVDIISYNGTSDNSTIIECATKMYIEQMRLDAYRPCVDVSAQNPDNYISDEVD